MNRPDIAFTDDRDGCQGLRTKQHAQGSEKEIPKILTRYAS